MCSVWIWEKKRAIISLYINWLVCITKTECVYCAVRTGYLNVIWVICFIWISEQIAISLYSSNWLVCITETECVYCAVRTGYLNVIWVICFIWISEQTAIISLYNINWLVCITETECVYCAVRIVALYTIQVNVNQKHSAAVRCSALHISCLVPKSNIGTCYNSFPCPSQQLQINSVTVGLGPLSPSNYVHHCCSILLQ